MTSEEYRRVGMLFERVLEERPTDREAWLLREAGTPAAAAEVSSLLAHHDRLGGFLTEPLLERQPDLLDDDQPMPPGAVVGTYTIVRELGRGGMGRVYLATDARLGRTVALKALPPALTRDEAQRERLRREARAAASLTHPGICTVYALEEIDGDLYIASELVDGRTLREEIASGPRPAARELLRVALELTEALASAHERGLTHRDLKPENVMRTRDGRLKIVDFGLALVETGVPGGSPPPRVTQPGAMVGTPGYMAPEQLNGGAASARSDVFALGVLLYELGTGAHPFHADTPLASIARVLEGVPRRIDELRPDLPPALVAAVDRSLQKAPDERFPSAKEMWRALSSTSAAEPLSGVTAWWRRHQVIVVGLYAIATAAAWQIKEWLHGSADRLFLAIGVSVVVAGVLRGHLLFTERVNRSSFDVERRRSRPLTLALDLLVAAVLAVDGLMVYPERPLPGLLAIGLAAGLALTRLIVEPTTTRSAFGVSR